MVSNTKTKTRDTEYRLLQILYMLPLFVLLLFIVFIILLIRQYQTDNQNDYGESSTYTIYIPLSQLFSDYAISSNARPNE